MISRESGFGGCVEREVRGAKVGEDGRYSDEMPTVGRGKEGWKEERT